LAVFILKDIRNLLRIEDDVPVGREEDTIRADIKNQEKEDNKLDQLGLFK
jgi:hypothetical protein